MFQKFHVCGDQRAIDATVLRFRYYGLRSGGDRPNPAGGGLAPSYSHTTNSVHLKTSPTVKQTANTYDANFRLKTTTLGNGTVDATTTVYNYDENGNQIEIFDPRSTPAKVLKQTNIFDTRNRKTRSISANPFAYITSWFYDNAGNVTDIRRPNGTVEHQEYDELNRPTVRTIPKDAATATAPATFITTTKSYWPSGMLHTVTDGNSHVTTFEYNGFDLKNKMIYPNHTDNQTWDYDRCRNLTSRRTVDGSSQFFQYDERNRVKTMRWSNGIDFSDFGYDSASHLTSARNPYSTVTRQYDDAGQLVLDGQALAAATNTAAVTLTPTTVVSRQRHWGEDFDIDLLPGVMGGSAGIECRTGGLSHSYKIVLTFPNPTSAAGATITSGIGQVQGVAPGNGNQIIVNLVNVSASQLLNVKLYGLNDSNSIGEVTVPMQVLVGDVDGSGLVDGNDVSQVQGQSRADITQSNFRCDVNANGLIDGSDVSTVQGNSRSFLPGAPPAGPQVSVRYTYNDDGKLQRLYGPAPGYDFTYGYDGANRLSTIRFTGAAPNAVYYQYTYDLSSHVTARHNYTNGAEQAYTYDELGRMEEYVLHARQLVSASGADDGGGPPGDGFNGMGQWQPYDFSHEYYHYDQMSSLDWTDRVLTSQNTTETTRDTFGYNDASEMTWANYGLAPNRQGTFVSPARAVSYNLDNAGNRNSVTNNGSVSTYTPNVLNQYGETSNGSEHEIAAFNGVSYQYLADTHLAQASSTSGGVYKLGYDALGRCVRRTTNDQATYYFYDGDHSIWEYDAGSAATSFNLYGLGIDEIIARSNNGDSQYLHQDHEGSTTAVTDSNGAIVEQYRYDAFGAPEFRTAPVGSAPGGSLTPDGKTQINNRFLFTGREWVQRYGFYEYRARAYHPGLGRFLSEDPKGFDAGDYNFFRYCGNDPLDKTDPMGLWTAPVALGSPLLIPPSIDDKYLVTRSGASLMAYGKGTGWEGRNKEWDKYNNDQHHAAYQAFKTAESMDAKKFERVFHRNPAAAPLDVAKVWQKEYMKGKALADDGSAGYFANARTMAQTIADGHPPSTMGYAGVGKVININVEHPLFWQNFGAHVAGHESNHNFGIDDVRIPGVGKAYLTNPRAYRALTPGQALNNSDSYQDFER